MRNTILIIHIISSLMVCGLTLVLVIRSIIGLRKKLPLKTIDTQMPIWIVVLLYLQMILGMLLFFYLITDYNNQDSRIAENGRFWMRFWAVEHFTLMVFTVIIGHIGYIYNKHIKTAAAVYKKNRLYFGITFLLICLSMVMSAIR